MKIYWEILIIAFGDNLAKKYEISGKVFHIPDTPICFPE